MKKSLTEVREHAPATDDQLYGHMAALQDAITTYEEADDIGEAKKAQRLLRHWESYFRVVVLDHLDDVQDDLPAAETSKFHKLASTVRTEFYAIASNTPPVSDWGQFKTQRDKWVERATEARTTLMFAVADANELLKARVGRPIKHIPREHAFPAPWKAHIAGLDVSFEGDPDEIEAHMEMVRQGLKLYRARVARVLPSLLRRNLPIKFDVPLRGTKSQRDSASSYGGIYLVRSVRINLAVMRSVAGVARTVAHEMAHHVYRTILSARDRKAWHKVWKRLLPVLKSAPGHSRYAATNEEEGFCEAFSVLVVGGPRTLDAEARQIMKTIVPGLKIESSLFNDEERNRLLEAIPGGMPKAIDLMGQAKSLEFTGATIGRKPNAFVVYALRPNGTRHEVASYYYQDDKPRAKRHAKWDATITLKSLKRTLGLTEATYEVDAKARAKANAVWDEVVAYVRKGLESGEELPKHNQTGGFYLPRKARLPHDLMVVLAPKGVQTGYGRGRKSGAHAIVMGDVLLGPHSTKYLDTRITSASFRREFVHEYVHLLDTLRTRGRTSTGQAMRSAAAGKLAGYFNTPAEYNAWSQDFAHAVEQDIAGSIRVARTLGSRRPEIGEKLWRELRQSVASLPAFLAHISKLDDERRIETMKGTKWERKWDKRLASLYRAMKREVEGAQ